MSPEAHCQSNWVPKQELRVDTAVTRVGTFSDHSSASCNRLPGPDQPTCAGCWNTAGDKPQSRKLTVSVEHREEGRDGPRAVLVQMQLHCSLQECIGRLTERRKERWGWMLQPRGRRATAGLDMKASNPLSPGPCQDRLCHVLRTCGPRWLWHLL